MLCFVVLQGASWVSLGGVFFSLAFDRNGGGEGEAWSFFFELSLWGLVCSIVVIVGWGKNKKYSVRGGEGVGLMRAWVRCACGLGWSEGVG